MVRQIFNILFDFLFNKVVSNAECVLNSPKASGGRLLLFVKEFRANPRNLLKKGRKVWQLQF
jgi:hypothetical protein